MGELLYIFEYPVCASATYVQIQLAGVVDVLTIFIDVSFYCSQ